MWACVRASAGGASSWTGVKKLGVTAGSDVALPVTVPAGGSSACADGNEAAVEHKREISAQAATTTKYIQKTNHKNKNKNHFSNIGPESKWLSAMSRQMTSEQSS